MSMSSQFIGGFRIARIARIASFVVLLSSGMTPLAAKNLGFVYGHLPSIRINQSGQFSDSSLGFGFHVGLGGEATPEHLVELGLFGFQLNARNPAPNSRSGLSTELNLGYLYHWSTDYDPEKKSHNVHVGVGYTSLGWSQRHEERVSGMVSPVSITSAYSGAGLYARVAYMYSVPLEKKPITVGVNFTWKNISNGVARVTDRMSSGGNAGNNNNNNNNNSNNSNNGNDTGFFDVRTVTSSQLNSFDLSLIIGTRF